MNEYDTLAGEAGELSWMHLGVPELDPAQENTVVGTRDQDPPEIEGALGLAIIYLHKLDIRPDGSDASLEAVAQALINRPGDARLKVAAALYLAWEIRPAVPGGQLWLRQQPIVGAGTSGGAAERVVTGVELVAGNRSCDVLSAIERVNLPADLKEDRRHIAWFLDQSVSPGLSVHSARDGNQEAAPPPPPPPPEGVAHHEYGGRHGG